MPKPGPGQCKSQKKVNEEAQHMKNAVGCFSSFCVAWEEDVTIYSRCNDLTTVLKNLTTTFLSRPLAGAKMRATTRLKK